MTSLYKKIAILFESFLSNLDWVDGVRKYTKQKGLLTNDEHNNGPPDSDDESDDA